MKIRIIAVGNRPPDWVREGYEEYAKRMRGELGLELVEIAPPKHHKDTARFKQFEGDKMRALLTDREHLVALDERGRHVSSPALAKRLQSWREQARDVAVLIGGSDGLHEDVKDSADETLALSHLTLPHYLVRVMFAEALYRAQSILAGHPYHRA